MTIFSSLFVASRTRDESLVAFASDLKAQLGFASMEQRESANHIDGIYMLAAWDGHEVRLAVNDEADTRLTPYRFWLGIRGEDRAAIENGVTKAGEALARSGRECFLPTDDYSRVAWSGQGRGFPSP